jgi:hypothetical protein
LDRAPPAALAAGENTVSFSAFTASQAVALDASALTRRKS